MKIERIEKFLVRNRERFGYIHFGMFILFMSLFLIPPFLPAPPEEAKPWNNFVLFAKFAVWGLWFPLILASVIIFGRAWCGLFCPQGALSEFLNKRGEDRAIPKWLRWEGTPIMSFIIITVLGQLVAVRDYPKPMLLIFGGTTIIAALLGYRYTKGRRVWCRNLCPVGLLLGIFSRLGMIGIERGEKNGARVVCPLYINLHTKVASRHCIECLRCVNPETPGTLRINLRRPGKEIEEIRGREPDIYEVIFLFLATGLALGGFHWLVNPFYIKFKMAVGTLLLNMGLGEFIGRSGPWWVMVNYPERGDVFNWLDFISVASFMLSSMLLFGGILFFLTILSSVLLREEDKSIMEKVSIIGYTYTPVALLSLILGLGAELFSLSHLVGLGDGTVKVIKLLILSVGVIWSLYLSYRLTNRQLLPQIPNTIGVALVAWAWYAVI